MHITVTDVLVCPRCGPECGLVLLADEVSERRVTLGTLGCPNCRSKYPIESGIVTLLRDAEQTATLHRPPAAADRGRLTQALEWAALLGIEGHGKMLIAGPAVRHSADLADLLPEVEVIALLDHGEVGDALDGTRADPTTRVTRIRAPNGFPLRPGGLAAAGLSGGSASNLLEPAARAVRIGGRVVLDPAPEHAQDRLREVGATVLAHEGETIVAVRS